MTHDEAETVELTEVDSNGCVVDEAETGQQSDDGRDR